MNTPIVTVNQSQGNKGNTVPFGWWTIRIGIGEQHFVGSNWHKTEREALDVAREVAEAIGGEVRDA
jgi:hypothetical protein